jgi:predicted ester cyclase
VPRGASAVSPGILRLPPEPLARSAYTYVDHCPRELSSDWRTLRTAELAMPDGSTTHTSVVGEGAGIASISFSMAGSPRAGSSVDFATADFLRVEDGLAIERWDTVDYVGPTVKFDALNDLSPSGSQLQAPPYGALEPSSFQLWRPGTTTSSGC